MVAIQHLASALRTAVRLAAVLRRSKSAWQAWPALLMSFAALAAIPAGLSVGNSGAVDLNFRMARTGDTSTDIVVPVNGDVASEDDKV